MEKKYYIKKRGILLKSVLKKIKKNYIDYFEHYSKSLLKRIVDFHEFPYYYSKEILRIFKSLLIVLFSKLNHNKFYKINRKTNGLNFNYYIYQDYIYRKMFFGNYSNEITKVLLKYLQKGSVFIDVGANIGYFSAIGAGKVGKKGQVHSFEPVSIYFKKLREFVNLNENYQIYANNYALGESQGFSNINISKTNLGWNTMVQGWMDSQNIKETVKVEVKRLDEYILKNSIKNISLIKIDVEGYEFPVLKGLKNFFEITKQPLPPIIVEIIPLFYSLLGEKLEDLEQFMKNFSYTAYTLNGKSQINIMTLNKIKDVLFKQN